jgi:trimeric autotransporter adhesin
VEYDMRKDDFSKNNFSDSREIGLLAQEVEKVMPAVVNEKDGYKGVDYAKLVPLLIEAIKEQEKRIQELEKQNQDLIKLLPKKNQ